MKRNRLFLNAGCLLVAASMLTSCMSDNDDTIVLETGTKTDIPSDALATPNPEVDYNNVTIPNIQYTTTDEDGETVIRIDMTGIQDKSTLEWLRLLGTGETGQNVWVEVDGKPKGIRVYNTADDGGQRIVPVDLVFLVDNSGSMSEEADAIARDIISWADKLQRSGLDIRFASVGYDGEINGACTFTSAARLSEYLNRASGTRRTMGFEASAADLNKFNNVLSNYRTGGGSVNECGMAALRFATDNFSFRDNANRIYVNFTDEPNQPNGISRFSVESLKTDWDTTLGTIHTVFSDYKETLREYNRLMSEYTGGTVITTSSSFSGVTLESLPVSDAMQNSYIIRFTNIEEFMDGKPHQVKITIYSPDGTVKGERIFYVVFTRKD